MKTLWKKESAKKDYVDIFSASRRMDIYTGILEGCKEFRPPLSLCRKSNPLALKYRNDGNQFYVQKNYGKAMEYYNKSLCYAEDGSEHLGFAYGNRSLCFFEQKLFGRCLIDIQLALDANYPEHLLHKLEKRKAACETEMDKEKVEREPNKSTSGFDADENGLSKMLKIITNEQYGRHIISDSDIDVEQTVLIEEPLADVLIASGYLRCCMCMKDTKNLVPCKGCVSTMFCSESCADNKFHRFECNMFTMFEWENDDGLYRNIMQSTVRLILLGLAATSTVDELIVLVEAYISSDGCAKDIVIAQPTMKSKFETILRLHFSIPTNDAMDCSLQLACLAYDTFLGCGEMKKMFTATTHQRFLMHLTYHLCGVFKTNRLTMTNFRDEKSVWSEVNVENFGIGLYNLKSYLNHSCVPNVVCLFYDKQLVCKAIKPIKKGEQLFISYMEVVEVQNNDERRDHLASVYGFHCQCQLCSMKSNELVSSPAMAADPNYKFAERNFLPSMFNETAMKTVREKLMKFLRKWGPLKPAKELIIVQQYLTVVMQILLKD